MKILIAEDVPTNRKYLIDLLKDYGEYDLAYDGLEALSLIYSTIKSEAPYELICLGIIMSEIDGLTVLKLTRDKEKQFGLNTMNRAKIIITAELDDKYLKQASFEYGCDGFINIPKNSEKLIKMLDKLGIVPIS